MSWFDYSAFENGMPFDEKYLEMQKQDKCRKIKNIMPDIILEVVNTENSRLEFYWQITKYNNLILVSTNFNPKKTKKKGS